MAPITYLQFHLLFVFPPLVVLGALAIRRDDAWWGPRPLSGLAIVLFLAFVYTTPWDNLLIAEGVWSYGEGTTLASVWHAPVGEYLFFLLQPVVTALWLFQSPAVRDVSLAVPARHRVAGAVAGIAVSVAGYVLLGTAATYYLGAILFWAGPILAIQWGFGWPYVWRLRRTVAVAVAVPTLYYWCIDRVALELGVWIISDAHTTGAALFGLPIEEALFFFVTNLFVVQCLLMYMWLLDRVGTGSISRLTASLVGSRPETETGAEAETELD
jgi:lycopene cyclase domain-containing protein